MTKREDNPTASPAASLRRGPTTRWSGSAVRTVVAVARSNRPPDPLAFGDALRGRPRLFPDAILSGGARAGCQGNVGLPPL